jgi:hypothetical protein
MMSLSSETPLWWSLQRQRHGSTKPNWEFNTGIKGHWIHSVYTLHDAFLIERKHSVYIKHDILNFTFTAFSSPETTPHTHHTTTTHTTTQPHNHTPTQPPPTHHHPHNHHPHNHHPHNHNHTTTQPHNHHPHNHTTTQPPPTQPPPTQ